MLTLKVTTSETYNETENRFLTETKDIRMEYSLAAISKWESIWEKPFLTKRELTQEENISFLKCMLIDPDDFKYFEYLKPENIEAVLEYMNRPMTATVFNELTKSQKKEIITADDFYYKMFSYGIPLECENWHFRRLITLLRIFNDNLKEPKKMSQKEIMAQNREVNRKRRAALKSKG